jgi:hypothetical protein
MRMEEALDFWISQLNSQGKKVHPLVLKAAYAVLPAAVSYGQHDPIAVELLAKTAYEVSRFLFRNGSTPMDKHGNEIVDMNDYLFKSYKKKVPNPYLTSAESNDVINVDPNQEYSDRGTGQNETEDHAEFWELYGHMKPKMQAIFQWRQLFGYRWREVGKLVGMTGHAAGVYYRRGLQKLRKRVQEKKKTKVIDINEARNKSREAAD